MASNFDSAKLTDHAVWGPGRQEMVRRRIADEGDSFEFGTDARSAARKCRYSEGRGCCSFFSPSSEPLWTPPKAKREFEGLTCEFPALLPKI